MRHAGAHRVRVQVCAEAGGVALLVADDGAGFDTAAVPPGRGLRFMAQRAQALGSKLEIQAAPRAGTAIRLLLPVQR
jgi:signal transduction histidine kinase